MYEKLTKCPNLHDTSRHVAPLRDGLSVTSQQQQQQSIGGSVAFVMPLLL